MQPTSKISILATSSVGELRGVWSLGWACKPVAANTFDSITLTEGTVLKRNTIMSAASRFERLQTIKGQVSCSSQHFAHQRVAQVALARVEGWESHHGLRLLGNHGVQYRAPIPLNLNGVRFLDYIFINLGKMYL